METDGIKLAEQIVLYSMPQKAASAWSAIEGELVGAGYKPLVFNLPITTR